MNGNTKDEGTKEESIKHITSDINEEGGLLLRNNSTALNDDELVKTTSDKPRAIDLILNSIGYTKYHYILFMCCGLAFFSEGSQLFSLYMLMPTINIIFSNSSEVWKTLLASALFFGYVIGTLFTGYLTKSFGRRSSIIILLTFCSIVSISIGLVENIQFMTFCRFIIGVILGIILPQYLSNLSEFLPSENKEIMLMSIFVCYRLGIIYFISCFSFISPDTDAKKWKEAMLTPAIPVVIVTVLTFIFFRDSPKLFLSKKEVANAVESLSLLKSINSNEEYESLNLLMEDINPDRKKIESSYMNIFRKDYCVLTLLCSLIFLSSSMVNVVITYSLPIILVKKNQTSSVNHDLADNHTMSQEVLITQIVTIPAIFISSILCKLVGRKNTIIIGLVFCFIATSIPAYLGKKLILSTSLVNFFVIFALCTIKVYILEVFPTQLRDYALSFGYCVSKLGDSITPLLCNLAFKSYIYGPLVISNVLCITGLISALLLPYDSLGVYID